MAQPTITDALVIAAQGGDADAMWSIVTATDPIILGMVRQVAPGATPEDREDLVQEGRAELIIRVRSYDPSVAAAHLQTYVYPHIRRSIAEEWARRSTGLTADPTTLLRVRRALTQHDGNREAALLSLHARYGIARDAVAAMEAMAGTEQLDAPVPGLDGDSGTTLADTLPEPAAAIDVQAYNRHLAAHLLTVIPSRQSYTLSAYHGVGMMAAGDDAVALDLRTSKARVRQLRAQGVHNARTYATDNGLSPAA
jgi:DNA-directed RNA polymerase sigma subunit (sigma70/sigma32)